MAPMTDPIAAFHAAVLADPDLQRRLDASVFPEAFAAAVEPAARELGIAPERLRPVARPAPTGAEASRAWAPPGWLPVRVHDDPEGPIVDWACFGDRPLAESFYHDSVAAAVARPFNRLFRHATRLDDLIADARPDEAPPLAGLVFHMSRCGSTLVSQMLGAVPGTLSLSEPGPLDSVVRLAVAGRLPRGQAVAALRATASALARRRRGEAAAVIKLDSWHVLALPLLREAFPGVPWVYLFREPVEVLVSHMRMRGYQTVPSLMPEGLYRLDGLSAAEPERLCAAILAQFHATALPAIEAGAGLAIDYAALPDAADRIASHFGLSPGEAAYAGMMQVASRDAKAQVRAFVPDAAAKRREGNDAVRAAAAEWLAEPHQRLAACALRGG